MLFWYFWSESSCSSLRVHFSLYRSLNLITIGLSRKRSYQIREYLIIIVNIDLINNIYSFACSGWASQQNMALHAHKKGQQIVIPNTIYCGNNQICKFSSHGYFISGNSLHPVVPGEFGFVPAEIVYICAVGQSDC